MNVKAQYDADYSGFAVLTYDACFGGKNNLQMQRAHGGAPAEEQLMWRETIETSTFARCHFCSEIIVAEPTPAIAQQCDGCGDGGAHAQPMNDNYFDVVMRVRRPARPRPAA
ncbi:MAG: hypothetical protein ACXW3G_01785 [Rhodoplanes sp.]